MNTFLMSQIVLTDSLDIHISFFTCHFIGNFVSITQIFRNMILDANSIRGTFGLSGPSSSVGECTTVSSLYPHAGVTEY